MKVYPLIYSRTKFCDYVSGFLVRPSDLDYYSATKYVSVALNEIKYSNSLRHAVFAVGDYIIYGGTACITSALVSRILKDRGLNDLDFTYKDYGSDHGRRPNIFFIGFAVKRSSIENSNLIPNVDLYETYKIYLKYLEKQWLNATIETQALKCDEAIEIDVTEYSAKFIPETIDCKGLSILKNYDEYSYQDIINYYYHEMVTNPDTDNSFLSSVLPEMVTSNFIFKNTSLYGITADEYTKSFTNLEIKSTSSSVNLNDSDDDTPKVYISSSEYTGVASQPNTTSRHPQKSNNAPTVYHSTAEYRQDQGDRERKKSLPTSGRVILAIAIALLVGIILFVAQMITAKKKHQPHQQIKSSIQGLQSKIPITNLEAEAMQGIKHINSQ